MNKLKLAAVIVSFNPMWNELNNLVKQLTATHGVEVFIVDNNSLNAKNEFCSFTDNPLIHTYLLNDNEGIAFAQNLGLRVAATNPFNSDFIFLFDQDSVIKDDFIEKMTNAYIELNDNKISAIGPIFSDSRYGFFYPIINMNSFGIRNKISPELKTEPIFASMLIASGMMLNVNSLKKIGYMNEELFIDYVDTEWCLRARSLGYTLYAIPDVKMKHAIGDRNIKFFLWRVPVHSPFRRYYRIRNSFYLLKMPHIPKLMACREIIFSFIHQLILITNGNKSKEYINSLWRGVIDGIRSLHTKK